MTFQPRCLPPQRLVRPVPIDPTGTSGPTRGQAAGPKWRRTGRNLYVPVWVDETLPEQRVIEQAVRLPEGGAVTGWGALRLAGAAYFDGRESDGRTQIPVRLALGRRGQVIRSAGARLTFDELTPGEVVSRQGVPVTTVLRALFDEMRLVEDWREAVVAMDMTAAAGLTSIRRAAVYAHERRGWRRARRVLRALEYADELSASPNETRMRLIWVLDAGLPAPRVNQPVFDLQGRLLGIADLLDAEAGVVGEYDGAEHRRARRHTRDVRREDLFRRAGLECFTVTALDLPDRARVVDRMKSARLRARFEAASARNWTLTPPPGWEPDEPLDSRLNHDEWLAEQVAAERRLVVRHTAGIEGT